MQRDRLVGEDSSFFFRYSQTGSRTATGPNTNDDLTLQSFTVCLFFQATTGAKYRRGGESGDKAAQGNPQWWLSFIPLMGGTSESPLYALQERRTSSPGGIKGHGVDCWAAERQFASQR